MTREIEPGDRVEWQGPTQMMSGFVQSVKGRKYRVRVFDGTVDDEHASDHDVDHDQILESEPGSA